MKLAYYFTATWCNPCKKTRPLVEEFNLTDSEVKYTILDVDENSKVAQEFGIQSVPTFIMLDNGVEIKRMVGSKTATELENFING